MPIHRSTIDREEKGIGGMERGENIQISSSSSSSSSSSKHTY